MLAESEVVAPTGLLKGIFYEESASPIEPKERTRTAVAREAKVPERKLRAAREVKKGARNPV